MDDEELTRLAVAQLIAEAEKFKRRHELRYKLDGPTRLRPNLRYFNNTVKNCVSSNERKDRIRKSKAAAELKCLDHSAKIMKKDENTKKTNNDVMPKGYSTERNNQRSTSTRKNDNNSKGECKKEIVKNKNITRKKLTS